MIESIKFYDKDLCDLTHEIELFPQVIENVQVQRRVPFENVPEIQDALLKAQNQLKDEGRVLLRYSGTEALARVMVEGRHQKLVSEVCKEMATVVQKVLG